MRGEGTYVLLNLLDKPRGFFLLPLFFIFRWFRSSCILLKECIDQRPQNGTDHFSPAFDDFSKGLVIDDPADAVRCGEVRVALGFSPNHPFDTEVCEKFESHMCDQFFTEVDIMVDNLKGSSFTSIDYVPIK